MNPNKINWFICMDCKQDTSRRGIREYYMIKPVLWESVVKINEYTGMLCIGCLENRIGRTLTPHDFTDCPLNREPPEEQSKRLFTRIGKMSIEESTDWIRKLLRRRLNIKNVVSTEFNIKIIIADDSTEKYKVSIKRLLSNAVYTADWSKLPRPVEYPLEFVTESLNVS